ncbi:MAG TPA: 3-phosphoshikimate 1-carboxyvinyltransferase, partial [Alphaproteobacteria bacterium]|nr:3-phosphoshikimate 1-carboxyvinyltransferase [Alphaproteobacteria bacterium]
AALSAGRSHITGLLTADDVTHTIDALCQCGVAISTDGKGDCMVEGVGAVGLSEPSDVINLGNSGTAARLLMGVVAGHPMEAIFTGDESLRSRPMDRVVTPLVQMGASVKTARHGGLPVLISGAMPPLPITYRLPVPSAQVKSAIFLAGLGAPGKTTVIESFPTRDHTENLLQAFGAEITVEKSDGESHITLVGQPELKAQDVIVPGDPSSAAFPLVAALITPDSKVVVRGIGMNERRTGLFQCLREMGADLEIDPVRSACGEPVADLTARTSTLKAIEVPAGRAPRMIDEYPILAAAAACADGATVMRGLSELRIKESDRLTAIARGLSNCGVQALMHGDTLTVIGVGSDNVPKGVEDPDVLARGAIAQLPRTKPVPLMHADFA